MDQDDTLFSWLRFYVSLLGVLVLLGVGTSALYLGLARDEFEAWSTVVEDGFRIPPRQVGPMAEVIFRSEATYGPAMEALGIQEDPRSFLSTSTDIRPVPETNVVIIIGRADDSQRAEEISAAMANSFVEAVEARVEFSNFTVFDVARTVPPRGEVSLPVGLSMGGAAAIWLGLGGAVLHYRLRRPVLGIARAKDILSPSRVTTIDGSWPSWLGICRPRLRWSDSESNKLKLATVASNATQPPLVVAPGANARGLKLLARRLPDGWPLHDLHTEGMDSPSQGDRRRVVVAHPGTSEMDLDQMNSGGVGAADDQGRRSLELLWVP
jgi:hypothetical protein